MYYYHFTIKIKRDVKEDDKIRDKYRDDYRSDLSPKEINEYRDQVKRKEAITIRGVVHPPSDYTDFNVFKTEVKLQPLIDARKQKATPESERGWAVITLNEEEYTIRINEDEIILDNNLPCEEKEKTKIFIIHGQDMKVKDEVKEILRAWGLCPIVLAEQGYNGSSIYEKLEKHSDVKYAIVLYTGCDEGKKVNTSVAPRKRARQNVVFEHGFFLSKLGRENVCMLYDHEVELPSDINGFEYISLSNAWLTELKLALNNIGILI